MTSNGVRWLWSLIAVSALGCGVGELETEEDWSFSAERPLGVAFEPVADTWVRGASVDANKGTLTTLQIDLRDSDGGERRTFLKFAVTGLQGQVVTRATLRLRCVRGGAHGGVLRAVSSTSWKERELTWRNQPSLGATLDEAGAVSTGKLVELDVTGYVQGDGVFGFALTTPSAEAVHYASREASSGRPQLVLETAPVDAGAPDAGRAQPADSGVADAGSADAGSPADAGVPTGAGPRNVLGEGIWISRADLLALPMSGPAWTNLKAAADASAGTPDLSDQDQDNNVHVLAKALVYARTGIESYRTEVRRQVMAAMGTEAGGRTLALGRELAAYVIAADLVGLDPTSEDPTFRQWLRAVMFRDLSGRTLVSTHEDRPNNWGTHAGASRAAAAAYLSKSPVLSERQLGEQQLARAAQVFRGYLGDRGAYAGFAYGELSWQANASAPVGVNPVGATKQGFSIDGALPDDMRRGCAFTWPPCYTGYAWEAMQGITVQAEILYRAGHDTWSWSSAAILRAVKYLAFLDRQLGGWWAEGDDEWNPWMINFAYGTAYPAVAGARAGKNMGFTDWTHDRRTRTR